MLVHKQKKFICDSSFHVDEVQQIVGPDYHSNINVFLKSEEVHVDEEQMEEIRNHCKIFALIEKDYELGQVKSIECKIMINFEPKKI